MLKSKNILVVEDEVLIAMEIAMVLKEHGANVVGPANSLADAFRLLSDESLRLDGALLDVNLHAETVFPLAAALFDRQIPFAFLTAYSDPDLPEIYRNAQVYQKPVDVMKLATSLRFEVMK